VNTDLEIALKLADEADKITISRFLALDLQVETKPDSTPVTEADKAVEQHIRNELARLLPADGVVGEEQEDTGLDASRQWIIDPIDGTKNYLRGVPVWATLIALVIDGVPVVGVISAPALGRRWWSSAGDGAFTQDVNGTVRKISVSQVRELADASFTYSDDIGWDKHGRGTGLTDLQQATWRSRAYGDFWSHIMVAEGVVDVAAEPDLSVWDMAAFVAIVHEAGGVVTGFDGSDALTHKSALTTNGHLHSAAQQIIAGH
jgi:histidinol-phosphatase